VLPSAIEREATRRLPADDRVTLGTDCEGSRYHSPRPLRVRPVETADGDMVQLCGTCHDNLSLLLALLGVSDLPWDAHRQFGNEIRKLARRMQR
jgi:hypothetical protein